jgi:hypothetical protein
MDRLISILITILPILIIIYFGWIAYKISEIHRLLRENYEK